MNSYDSCIDSVLLGGIKNAINLFTIKNMKFGVAVSEFDLSKVFEMEKVWFLKKEHLVKTQHFYDKHGGIALIITRFMPIVRTFAPFIAGVSGMRYKKFLMYNVIGGITWVSLFAFGGYAFGNFEIVKHNFTLVIYGILFISVLPAFIGFIKQKYFTKKIES